MTLELALIGVALVLGALFVVWSIRQPLGFSRRKPVSSLGADEVLALAQDSGLSPVERRKRLLLAGYDRARVRWSGPVVRAFEGEQSFYWLSFFPERRSATAGATAVSAAFSLKQRDHLLALRPGTRVTVEATVVVGRDGEIELHDPLLASDAT